MRRAVLMGLGAALLVAAFATAPAAADEQADRAAAIAAATRKAEEWLQAMDEQRFGDAWKDSAAVVRQGGTEEEWVREFGTPREAFGKTMMRELKRSQYSTRVRGAPEGEYVTAVFLTQFKNTPLALEIVLLSREDGEWRIGGYDVGPASDAPAATQPAPGAPSQPKKE